MCKDMCKGGLQGHYHKHMKSLGLLCLRVAIGVIFMYMGYNKLGPNHAMTAGMMAGLGFPGGGEFWAYLVGTLEFVGGAMVLLGVYAPVAAGWLSIIMVVALLTVHLDGPFVGSFLPLAVLGGCLAIIGTGAGRYRLMHMQCPCKDCKMGGMGGGCGGSCGGSCGGCGSDKMEGGMMKSCACQKCCNGSCDCGAKNGMCGHCMK